MPSCCAFRRSLHARQALSVADTVALLGAAVDAAEARGLTGLALRAACDLADLAPEATESVNALLKKIEGGHGTRDHSWPKSPSLCRTHDQGPMSTEKKATP